jgi:type IV pilus assembly protein PilW
MSRIRAIADMSRPMSGFSLVELMVSITLGLLILAGMLSVFASNSRSRDELQRAERQVESGRYAIKVLGDDIQLAGYWAEFNISLAGLAIPTTLPDPCDTRVTTFNAVLPVSLQGYDDPVTASIPACIGTDVRPNTDIIVIRRVSTCVAGPTAGTNCDAVQAGLPYFQASLCENATELGAGGTNAFRLDTTTGNLDRHLRDCSTTANEHQFLTRIYFVANNDIQGDGIPTLKRADLALDTSSNVIFTVTSVAPGVENLQISYLLDTNGDGTPDAITTDPNTYNGCAGAACVVNWTNVVAVQVSLLVRNTDATLGFSDTKTYSVGLNPDGTTKTVGPFGDGYKRHVYAAQFRLYNVAGRREP